MARLIVFASRHPLALGLLILLVTVAAASRLGGLRFELSTESMMAKDDPGRAFYRQTLDTFGADAVTVVFLSDPGLFRPDKLQAVRAALRTIEALPSDSGTAMALNLYIRADRREGHGLSFWFGPESMTLSEDMK